MSSQCVVARIENVYLQIHICSGLIDCINLEYNKAQHVSISIIMFGKFTYNIICSNNMILNFGKLLIDQSTNHHAQSYV